MDLVLKFGSCNTSLDWRYDQSLSIYSIKVSWNDHLVSYFLLIYHYGINTNIFYLTFSRGEFNHFV